MRGAAVEDIYELTPLQEGMLFETLYAPASGVYCEQLVCRLEGALDAAAFRVAWELALERHAVLRTSFHWEDLEKPLQVVHRQVALPLTFVDWRRLGEAEQERRLAAHLVEDRRRGFELERAPLLRLVLARRSESSHALTFSFHHLLLDGWSLSLLLAEVFSAYGALTAGEPRDRLRLRLPRPAPFAGYIAWLQRQDLTVAEAYWRRRLSGFRTATPLGGDRPAARGGEHRERRVFLSAEVSRGLEAFARRERVTPGVLVQAAWALLLARHGGDDDVVFGSVVSGRPGDVPGVGAMVGAFINTLPVRVQAAPRQAVGAWLRSLMADQAESQAFQHTPLSRLTGWSELPPGAPLFESLLAFENYPVEEALRRQPAGLAVHGAEVRERTAYPLEVVVVPRERLRVDVVYDAARYDATTAERLLREMCTLLVGLSEAADRPVAAVPWLGAAERHQVLHEWGGAAGAGPLTASPTRIDRQIAARAAAAPDRIAVVAGDRHLSYGELAERAERLAGRLDGAGAAGEERVGLLARRGPEALVAQLAALGAGAAYLPLDPEAPPRRLRHQVVDAGVSLVLSERTPPLGLLPEGVRVLVLGDLAAAGGASQGDGRAAAGHGAAGEAAAYVLYTSGSTGLPKGVVVSQAALAGRTDALAAAYELAAGDRVLQFAPPTFDVAAEETFPTLCRGATLVLWPPEPASAAGVVALARRQALTVVNLPAPLWHEWVADLEAAAAQPGTGAGSPAGLAAAAAPEVALPEALRLVVVGSDAVSAARLASWRRRAGGGVEWRNAYGLTEATITSTLERPAAAEAGGGQVPIGRPLAGVSVRLLDRAGAPIAPGATGELHLGGEGLARGYLGRPRLTAERFLPDAFSPRPGQRLFRTGDLARFRPDGRLELVGRADAQVKVRGFRIELGEVESALRSLPSVREAVVVAQGDPGDRRLVAYVVPEPGRSAPGDELRRELAETLPAHMMPAVFVGLRELPRTASGKLDRRRLPAPQTPAGEGRAPRGPFEELVAEVFADVLSVAVPSVEAEFFSLGGHSLLATRAASRLARATGREVPLRWIFETPSVGALAARLSAAASGAGEDLVPLVATPRTGPPPWRLPVSFAQRRLWMVDRLEPGSAAYNMPLALDLRGRLDVDRLTSALDRAVRRHEVLRTRFREIEGEPWQVIDAPPERRRLPRVDLAALPPVAREREARRLERSGSRRPFDLASDPPLRVTLLALAADEHVLLLTLHHIAADGWSLGVLTEEVSRLYAAGAAAGEAASPAAQLPPLPVQYGDFAVWQRARLSDELVAKELEHWRERLRGLPEELELPVDRPRPAGRGRGGSRPLRLDGELVAALRAYSRRQGATLFMTLLAGFEALLARLTGRRELAIGTPISGRDRLELEPLVGFFVNTLVLRADLGGVASFEALTERVREVTLDAHAHQTLPFERLVEELAPRRRPGSTPLFQVMFAVEELPPERLAVAGLEIRGRSPETAAAKFDLVAALHARGDAVGGSLQYRTDWLDGATVERWAGWYQRLLAAAMADPGRPPAELPLLSPAEWRQLTTEWGEGAPVEAEARVDALFAAAASRRPDAVALSCRGSAVTYGALLRRADGWAKRLHLLGVRPGDLVALCAERGPEVVASLLGILRAGAAYLAVDPDYPTSRRALMLDDSAVRLVLVDRAWDEELGRADRQVVALQDGPGDGPGGTAADAPPGSLSPGALAYVAYTSGSTGRPKGVAVPHRAVVRLIEGGGSARFGEDRVFLALAPLAFDASTLELFAPLLHGGRLAVAPPGRLSLHELGRFVAEQGVTTLWLTTGLFHQWVDAGMPGAEGVDEVLTGGEQLSAAHARRAQEVLGPGNLTNAYGPTENTTFTTCHRLEELHDPELPVSIGRPIAGSRIAVVDRELRPVVPGAVGELVTGGLGLAWGYLGRPGPTAELFVPDPLSGEPGSRLYRTGDQVRHDARGRLQFVGRRDEQVKVRGFRIEPGEVESALAALDGVRDAVVVAVGDPGGKRLVAYVVAGDDGAAGSPDGDGLRRRLAERLPLHMVPAVFVFLDELPLNANGKVDRRALPAPEPAAAGPAASDAEPVGPTEALLAGLFAEVLGLPRVPRDADFFTLGGHSLLAIRITSRLLRERGLEVPVRLLFEHPSVAALAAALGEAVATPPGCVGGDAVAPPPLVRRRHGRPRRLSFAQERLWFLDRLQPGSSAYNVPTASELSGAVDVPALQAALGELVARHEVLRTVYRQDDEEPVQVIRPPGRVPLPAVDLAALPPAARRREVERLFAVEAGRPFDLARDLMLRALLVRIGGDEHGLLLTAHHIATDGWSMEVLRRDLAAAYAAAVAGRRPDLPPLPVQYADFAEWQREWLRDEVLAGELAWWREGLADLPPLLELPTDHLRPAVRSDRGGLVQASWPAELAAAVARRAREQRTTPFVVLLAAFQGLLARTAGTGRFAVGTPVAGRDRLEVEDLVGFFANTLALRCEVDGAAGFADLVARVRDTVLDAQAHAAVPFERVVEELAPARTMAHTPIFQVMFNHQAGEALGAGETAGSRQLAIRGLGVLWQSAKFDLVLMTGVDGERLRVALEYSRDLFDEATARALVERLERLTAAFLAAPGRPLADAPWLSAAEARQVVEQWPPGAEEVVGVEPLGELIAARAAAVPERVAVTADGHALTYGELVRRADRLAGELRKHGVGREARVGLCLPRSVQQVEAVLATWRAGAAYVPLDPDLPEVRLRAMLELAQVEAVIVGPELPAAAAAALGGVAEVRTPLPPAPAVSRAAVATPPAAGDDGSGRRLAYVLFTSGSTGEPKGVMVEHRALNGLLHAMEAVVGGEDAVPLHLSFNAPLWFDASLQHLLGLARGHTLHVVPDAARRDPEGLARWLAQRRLDRLDVTPSQVRALLEAAPLPRDLPPSMLIGGEAIEADLWRRLAALPGVRAFNVYGPTEATVNSTWAPVGGGPEPHLGRPLSNRSCYLLDQRLRPVPPGVPGELWLGGEGSLARCYAGRARQTAERFRPDPFSAAPGARLYRTGDGARWRRDGTLVFLGRLDTQVKLRGYRIELAEIEAALAAVPAVAAAAVVLWAERPGRERLVAYVVPQSAASLDSAALQRAMLDRLPAYMLPSAFVSLAALPLTANGKLDRRALPAPEGEAGAGPRPRTVFEQLVADVYAEVLEVAAPGADADFFVLGGHSLLATRVVSRLSRRIGREVPLRWMFEAPSVAALAARLGTPPAAGAAGAAAPPPLLAAGRPGPPPWRFPLSYGQRRLWLVDQMQPGSPAYNMPLALELRGALDVAGLAAALARVVERHEVLRTRYEEHDGEPWQVVEAPAAARRLPVVDLSALPPEGARCSRQAEARRWRRLAARRTFDLAAEPPLRTWLLRLGEDEHLLLVTMHHIASDGWSVGVLDDEVARFYGAWCGEGSPSPPALPVQYGDYASWQRSWLSRAVLDAEIEHWRRLLAGVPSELELPADRPRAGRGGEAGVLDLRLDAQRVSGLRAFSRQQGVTLFMTLLAGFQGLLGRLTGQRRLAVGTPVAGRDRVELEPLIGFFVNTLVLPADLGGDPGLAVLAERAREVTLEAHAHQAVPFERLVEELAPPREVGRTPLFQVMFALQNVPPAKVGLGSVEVRQIVGGPPTARFELTVALVEAGDEVVGQIEFDRGRYDEGTVRRWAAWYERLLAAAAAEPRRPLAGLSLLTPAERDQLLGEWGGGAAVGAESTLDALFAAVADRRPDAVALAQGTSQLTYGALAARAAAWFHGLRRLGVRPGALVGLAAERGLETIAALLGILRAGAAYVALDPSYPPARRALMIDDAGVRVVLAERRLEAELRGDGRRVVALDEGPGGREGGEGAGVPGAAVSPDALAYVAYTSGSTGRPKGVAVPHRAVARLVRGGGTVRFGDERVFLALAPLAFDASTLELFGPLLNGGRLAVAPAGSLSIEEIGREVAEQGVTTLWLTAGLFHQAVDAGLPGLSRVDELLAGGDVLSPHHVRRAQQALSGGRLINGYGPTENTTFTTCHALDEPHDVERPVPIGRPIPGTRVTVVDAGLRLVAAGEAGELVTGGLGLAWGYLGRPALTAERFVPDPWSDAAGARLYRTGDRVRFDPAGRLLFEGRGDEQVKVRGFRVEPGEVEAELVSLAAVREALVVARSDAGDKRLVAYVVPQRSTAAVRPAATADELRRALSERLPAHMVPAAFVQLDALPLGPNGKVDRGALPEPRWGERAVARQEPRTPVERELCRLWEELLEVPRVGVLDSFFELGGHSLLGVRLISRVRQSLGGTPRLVDFLRDPTVEGLAGLLADPDRPAADEPPVVRLGGGEQGLPLVLVYSALGEVSPYLPLARALDGTRPVLGVPVDATASGPATVEALAERVISRLDAAGLGGPCHLGGWSAGGVIAFEVARQLAERGTPVGLLALLDSLAPGSYGALRDEGEGGLERRFEADLAGAVGAGGVDPATLSRWRRAFTRCLAALPSYRPRHYSGCAVVFTTAGPGRGRRWRRYVRGELEILPVTGDHYGVLRLPHVAEVARSLAERMAAVEAAMAVLPGEALAVPTSPRRTL